VLYTQNMGDRELLAVIPAGHPVRVNKVMRQHNIGDYSDFLFGEVTLKGTTYPLKHLVGLFPRPDDKDELREMFLIKE
ncbi:MAG: hypothetical protein JWR15_2179, partial [Prosthecobacter sp.]|nr:hypothetical protein [Prosthecobacter sp.]